MVNISNFLSKVKDNIKSAAQKSGCDYSDIVLVCVAKRVPVELMQEAIDNGADIIGENRVEEAEKKISKLNNVRELHMIGHLQTRKVKEAVKLFDLIHSVDSVKLAKEIDKRSMAVDKIQDILIEVNVSGEETKYGFTPVNAIPAIKEISMLRNVKVQGLMTMAPFSDNPELTRPVFRRLKELSERIKEESIPGIFMRYLSMGMSQDYTVAIEEGSNMVRIGTAIFKD